jgi:uncharacterized protein YgbK (DUF1537 family)
VIRYVLADDLSGAADSAVHLRRAAGVRLTMSPAEPWGSESGRDVVEVHDTETRNLEPGAASDVVRAAVKGIEIGSGPPPLFKKIDSTLRGNVGEEVMAVAFSLGFSGVVVAPALPAQGRTVSEGRLLVGGRPVSSTEVARDPRKPVTRDVVGEILGMPVHNVTVDAVRSGGDFLAGVSRQVLVVDAIVQDDLGILARLLRHHPELLPAGSAGLAMALAARDRVAPNLLPEPSSAVVVVAGSANPVTREQVSRLRTAQCPGVMLLDIADQKEAEPAEMVRELGLRAQSWFASFPEHPALLALGGDTAVACCRALGEDSMWVMGEIVAGAPWGTLERSGSVLVTKAGGFGGPDVLVEMVERLMGTWAQAPC